MKTTLLRFLSGFAQAAVGIVLCFGLPTITHAFAPQAIVFERYDQAAGRLVQQLTVMNPDGTGEQLIPVTLPEWGFPTWSRDGQLLALASVAPATPWAMTRNVFVLSVQTGQIRQVTGFRDTVNTGSSAVGSSCVFPWHKAFSPDGSRVAVAAWVYSGITWSSPDTNSPPPNPNDLYSGFKATPMLQVYGLDGTAGPLVALGGLGGDTIHSGDGVDWAPNQDLIVYPLDRQFRVTDEYGQVAMLPATPLFLMSPVADAINTGKATQLTFPQIWMGQSWSGPYITWETDFQPAFSPDGRQVAYVRSENNILGAYPVPETHSLRLVNVDGSNDHQILSLQRGKYVSHLTWSPKGDKLAFDLGDQALTQLGTPMTMAQPATCSIWTVSPNGSGLTQLRAAAAAWPAWYPGVGVEPERPRLDAKLLRQPTGRKLVLGWPVNAGNVVLQKSPTLGPGAVWTAEPTQRATAADHVSVTLDATTDAMFFRLSQ